MAELPLFEFEQVHKLGEHGELVSVERDVYRCTRVGCGGEFEVEANALVEACARRGLDMAPCPFCFKVSRVPGTMGEQQELA